MLPVRYITVRPLVKQDEELKLYGWKTEFFSFIKELSDKTLSYYLEEVKREAVEVEEELNLGGRLWNITYLITVGWFDHEFKEVVQSLNSWKNENIQNLFEKYEEITGKSPYVHVIFQTRLHVLLIPSRTGEGIRFTEYKIYGRNFLDKNHQLIGILILLDFHFTFSLPPEVSPEGIRRAEVKKILGEAVRNFFIGECLTGRYREVEVLRRVIMEEFTHYFVDIERLVEGKLYERTEEKEEEKEFAPYEAEVKFVTFANEVPEAREILRRVVLARRKGDPDLEAEKEFLRKFAGWLITSNIYPGISPREAVERARKFLKSYLRLYVEGKDVDVPQINPTEIEVATATEPTTSQPSHRKHTPTPSTSSRTSFLTEEELKTINENLTTVDDALFRAKWDLKEALKEEGRNAPIPFSIVDDIREAFTYTKETVRKIQEKGKVLQTVSPGLRHDIEKLAQMVVSLERKMNFLLTVKEGLDVISMLEKIVLELRRIVEDMRELDMENLWRRSLPPSVQSFPQEGRNY